MKKKYTLLQILQNYKQVIFIVTAILITVGMIALIQMPRDEFPTFKIPQGLIIGVYPGASSHQIEDQLTTKVENYLFRYQAVNRAKTYSISKENVMVTTVEVNMDEKDPDGFWLKLRHGLNELKGDLPAGVILLTADNDFGNTSAMLLAVRSKTKTYKELEDYVKQFEADVRKVPSVSRVKRIGLQREQISVYIDDAKLAHYGIKPLVVWSALKPQSMVGYAGDIDDGKFVRPIHIPSHFKTEQDIANQIIYSDPQGHVIRVKDVANVVREYDEPSSFIRVNGEKCLIVSLEMQNGMNIVQFGKDVNKQIRQFSKSLPPDIKVETISNIPDAVSKAISNFLREFGIAIIAVILVTLLLLPMRVALVAASTIPISVLITLGIMWIADMDLQTVSLAGLIIVLGMVVDNAIVIIDNYVEKLDNNIAPAEAASQSVTDLFGSVFSATLIIISCFIPLRFFMTGVADDFVKSLPATITIALFTSLFASAVLVPLLSYMYIKFGIKSGSQKSRKTAFLDGIQNFYDGLLEKAFSRKKRVTIIGALAFIIGIIILVITPQQPFPKVERNQLSVEVHLPEGSSLKRTDAVMKEVEAALQKDPRVKTVAAFVGTSSPRFHALYAPSFPEKSFGQFIILTQSNKATAEILDEYSAKFTSRYPDADIQWKQLEFAVYKSPIEVRISGNDIEPIKKVSNQVADILRRTKGTSFVRTDYKQPVQTINLDIKKDEASRLGYSNTVLDYSLMTGTKGLPVATIWEEDYPVDVKLKVDAKTKLKTDDINNQYVTSPFFATSVPLRQLADLKPGWTEGEIIRRNGVRTVTVQSDVKRGLYTSNIFHKVKPQIDKLKLPEGVKIEYGGEYADNIEYLTPLYYSLAVSIAIIFLILMFQFRNARTSLLIMLTMPLSISGAAFGVLVMGYPLSVTAFIGIIGLMGIVVRNGIIYVSYTEELRREHGLTLEEAAISAAKRRMRPIFLTSSAAAVGVVPMIISRSSLWGPLGSVICFGLIFGLVLSLLVLPVLYYYFHRSDFDKPQESETL